MVLVGLLGPALNGAHRVGHRMPESTQTAQ